MSFPRIQHNVPRQASNQIVQSKDEHTNHEATASSLTHTECLKKGTVHAYKEDLCYVGDFCEYLIVVFELAVHLRAH